MCHLWEPMRHWYRPLGFYLFMEVAAFVGNLALRAAGFKQATYMGITYFTRNPRTAPQQAADESGNSGDEAPLVLLHGIGMGLIPYISLLFNMAATGRPVLALQMKHISMRWVLWVPTVDEVAEVLVGILRREHVDHCCLVAHSYGTAVASRLLQQHPQKILQLCMIDPICFSMFMPNLLRNFLYESPRTGSLFGDFMMMSAARDLHVSATLSRRFFWTDVNLWEEQLPAGSLVVLSGKDVLMAAAEVKAWLELRTDAAVLYHPTMPHAGFLMDVPWQQQILQQLLPMLDHVVAQQQQEQQQNGPAAPLGSTCSSWTGAQQQQQPDQDGPQSLCSGNVGNVDHTREYQQQQYPASTACSTVYDSCSRAGSRPGSFELSAVAAIAAATGMGGYPHPHALAGVPSVAVDARADAVRCQRVSYSSNSSSMGMRPMPAPSALDAKPGILLSQVSNSSRASSAGAAGRVLVSSSSSSSSHSRPLTGRVSSSSTSSASGLAPDAVMVAAGLKDGCVQPYAQPASTVSQQQQCRQQIEALQSWDGVVPGHHGLSTSSTPHWATSSSSLAQYDARSVASTTEGHCSAADWTDSPRTYFSGASNQSWQDFAQLAHNREAAAAARALLQPLMLQQQQQHSGTGLSIAHFSRLSSEGHHIHRLETRGSSGCTAEGLGLQRSVSASRREGMLRRVDVLLHRRGGRQGRSTGGGLEGVGRCPRSHGGVVL
eukprot:GHUV01008689.1.p1 GENE.GHUV01008689.1~~GHUV01008689.1.p1  ORF type:complete len:717 (+),score=294.35 GHUV01008689.1:916-3066(+)